jgi:hypothetical protein
MPSDSSTRANLSQGKLVALAGAATLLACLLTAAVGLLLRGGSPSQGDRPRELGIDPGPRQELAQEWLHLRDPQRQPTQDASVGVPEAPPNEDSGPSQLVFVHTADGTPVPSATVTCLIDGRCHADRRSDANGMCPLPLPQLTRAEILASGKPGFGRLVLESKDRPVVVELMLSNAGVLGGQVKEPSGRPVSAGVEVLAVRANLVNSFLREQAAPTVEPGRVGRTRTDDQGRFRLEGLEPGGEYTLWAHGQGLGTPTPQRSITGQEDLELIVWPVYGLALNFVESSGQPARISEHLQDLRHSRVQWFTPDSTPLHPESPVVLGLGLPSGLTTTGPGRLFLVAAPEFSSAGLGLRYACNMPGYEPIELELSLQPLSLGRLARLEVVLRPTASGLGRLIVVARDQDAAPRALPDGRLILRRPGLPVAESLEFVHSAEPSGVLELDAIPLGPFELNWFSTASTLSWPEGPTPPQLVEIVADGSVVEMLLQPTYSLEIIPTLDDGRSWRGSLSVRFGPADKVLPDGEGGRVERDVVFRTLDGPPYLLEDLTKPDYHLVLSPRPGGAEVEAWAELEPGVVGKVEVSGLEWR